MNALFRAISITKQGFHQYMDRSLKKESMGKQIVHLVYKIRQDHPTMGIRDIYFKLWPEGIGRDRFENLCREFRLYRQRRINYIRTTDSRGVTRFDNLLEGLSIERINQVWQSDITYYEVNGRFYYITFIQDAYTKMILGHHVSARMFTEDTTLPALQMAIKRRKQHDLKGLIFHSDGGGQYYDKEFLKITGKHHMSNSMCEYAWENGMAERLNGVIKNNYLVHRKINSFSALIKEVDRAVLLYNKEKPHKRLHRKTPCEFEKELLILQPQTKLTMTESLDANTQVLRGI